MEGVYLIGIAGGSGSGKTSFVNGLRSIFSTSDVCIISQDDYYRPKNEQITDIYGVINYDLPTAINDEHFIKDILSLLQGKAIEKTEYTFNNPNKAPEIKTIYPAKIIIVEGLFIYWFEHIRNMFHLKIFIDIDEDIALKRRLKRDIAERASDEDVVKHQWNHHVNPAYKQYLLPFKNSVDIIINNDDNYKKGFEIICHHLEMVLKKDI